MTPPVALTISCADAGGGTGIQADLQVFAAYRCHGVSAVTSLTAQNTHGVRDVYAVPGAAVGTQLASVLDELPVAAAKVGMLGSAEAAAQVASRARGGGFRHLVVDPVLVAAAGQRLGVRGAIERLLPYATVVTPNREEASALLGWQVQTPTDMAGAAAQLANSNSTYVVITGGDLGGGESIDAVWTPKGSQLLRARRVVTRNNQGTGAAFSAAITALLARGEAVDVAVRHAKDYVSRALAGAVDWRLGTGPGPLDHHGWGPAV